MNRVEEYNRKYGKYLIGLEEYKCNKCKKIWQPTDQDINRKVMMTYYKCCGVCREYLMNRELARRNNILAENCNFIKVEDFGENNILA